MNLPETILRDDVIWGFRESFDDRGFLQRINSPRLQEGFGDADRPVPNGRSLWSLVREICREHDIAQPWIWAKLIGETGFVTAKVPPGKGYKAPLGFDCPDGGKDPRPEFYGVERNLRGGIAWWRTFLDRWNWQRRLDHGMSATEDGVNVSPEGQGWRKGDLQPRTRAEVAYLIYTPHVYSLHDMLAILKRYGLDPPQDVVQSTVAGETGAASSAPTVSAWAKDARDRMMALGVTDGTNPQGVCTREMSWTMLDKLWTKVQEGRG